MIVCCTCTVELKDIYFLSHILKGYTCKKEHVSVYCCFLYGVFLLWVNESRLRLSGVLMSVSVSLCGVHTPTRGG